MSSTFPQKDIQNPHFQMPLRFGGLNGGIWMNEQDSDDDVYDCVKAVVAYPIGSNIMQPAFGMPDIVFRQITAAGIASTVQQAVRSWEPRAGASVTEDTTRYDELVRALQIRIGGEL